MEGGPQATPTPSSSTSGAAGSGGRGEGGRAARKGGGKTSQPSPAAGSAVKSGKKTILSPLAVVTSSGE